MAAHGHVRADNPLFSSLALADGPYTVYDLEGLTQTPHHVVLAACDTALAHVTAGEEILGLSATLLAKGTASLVASRSYASRRPGRGATAARSRGGSCSRLRCQLHLSGGRRIVPRAAVPDLSTGRGLGQEPELRHSRRCFRCRRVERSRLVNHRSPGPCCMRLGRTS